MWPYVIVFFSALALDLIPFFLPPAWVAMVFLMVRFDLNPWLVLIFGTVGATVGRYLFAIYVARFSTRFIKRAKNEDLEFLGQKLTQTLRRAWLFVLLYTLAPISTTPLMIAAGIAKVKPVKLLPPFFVGKLVSNGVVIFAGQFVATDIKDMFHGSFSVKGILVTVSGILFVAALFFINWRALLQHRQFKFTFKIWK